MIREQVNLTRITARMIDLLPRCNYTGAQLLAIKHGLAHTEFDHDTMNGLIRKQLAYDAKCREWRKFGYQYNWQHHAPNLRDKTYTHRASQGLVRYCNIMEREA